MNEIMKKAITLFLCLAFCLLTYSQNKKIKVAVGVQIDTVFTAVGAYSTRTFDVNMTKYLLNDIRSKVDTSFFELNEEVLPDMLKNKAEEVGQLDKHQLVSWCSSLKKKKGYDLVLLLYKPETEVESYSFLNGFSYGMTVSDNKVFSLNSAVILDTRDASELSNTGISSNSEFMTRLLKKDRFQKPLRDYTVNDLSTARVMIENLDRDFAIKVLQGLQVAKTKLGSKK